VYKTLGFKWLVERFAPHWRLCRRIHTKPAIPNISYTQTVSGHCEETDLTGAVFDNCDLTQAIFDHTILEKADFRTSYNYSFDPEINRIKKAKFSVPEVSGLLDKYDIDIEK